MTTPTDVRMIAEEVARATVKEFFLALGVNADDAEAVIAVQKDFAHLRAWREATETVKRKGLAAAVSVIVTAMLGLIWLAVSRH
ncbi:hypothetical protein [Bradyrhizobium sp. WD16]|uniref:hypothetical protein n=1 Tax=Bradyrhizobium sp. WD16 TaxID=1521768 RepID=UPI0020A57145|nr:hypothetical protein [Bradyrhizobium sp. WD16]